METWKPCLGFEKYLEVSNLARVRTLDRLVTFKRNNKEQTSFLKGKNISPCKTKNGYLEVSFKNGDKRTKLLVHRLVAMAFVPGYSPELSVNHIDGNKLNNNLNNLEWVTLARNTQHQWEIGLVNLRGDNNPRKKLSSGKVRILRDLLKLGATPNSLATLIDISPRLIYMIRDNKRWCDI